MLSYLQGAAGGILLFAGVAKLLMGHSDGSFLRTLGLPGRAAQAAEALTPIAEITLAVLLLASVADSVVGGLAAALAVAAVGIQLRAVQLGVDEDCQCFGSLDIHNRKIDVARATALLVVAVSIVFLAQSAATGSANWLFTTLGALAGVGFILASGLVAATWPFLVRPPVRSNVGPIAIRS
jgi:hypothetical protein